MKTLVQIFSGSAAMLTALLLTGCVEWSPGRNGSFETHPLQPRNTAVDFGNLQKLFRSQGGNLFVGAVQIVPFREYNLFRLYEFPTYTVLMYPYDWSERRFEIAIFSGVAPVEISQLNDVGLSYRHQTKKTLTKLELHAVSDDARRIGFGPFRLGQTWNEMNQAADKYSERIKFAFKTLEPRSQIAYIDELNLCCYMYFENDKMVYMRAGNKNGPVLSQLGLVSFKPVPIRTGQIKVFADGRVEEVK